MDESRQNNVLDLKCEKVIDAINKSTLHYPSPHKHGIGMAGNQNCGIKFASQTPEKINQPLHVKSKEAEVELLRRHKAMIELFESMSCSLRLLGLRKKPPTFQNVRIQVEVLTGREFSYKHLAQLKYLLSESIEIDKILVHDKKTLCMKPEMKITLQFNEIEGHNEQSDYIALHELFASRLINYVTVNPEVCEIPEAILPDPFNKNTDTAFLGEDNGISEAIFPEPLSQSQTFATEQLLANASVVDPQASIKSELLAIPSHMHPNFSRHFSNKGITENDETELLATPVPLSSVPSSNLNNQDSEVVKARELSDPCSKSDIETNLDTECEQVKESLGKNSISEPIINLQCLVNTNSCGSPLPKLTLSADNLMVETPAQSIPKRITPLSEDNRYNITNQPQTSSSCKAAKRSLNFSFLEGDESENCELFQDTIPRTLDASSELIQKKVEKSSGCGEEHNSSSSDLLYQQLPNLVSLIHHIFQSVNYSAITKEELVHKIIINCFDFDETRQVEEQIEILGKLVPDWICMKLAASGDVLYSIKKALDLNSIQSRVGTINNN